MKNKFLISICIILIISITLNVYLYLEFLNREEIIREQLSLNQKQSNQINSLLSQITDLKNQLNYYENLTNYYSSLVNELMRQQPINITIEKYAEGTIYAAAVKTIIIDPFFGTYKYEGTIMNISCQVNFGEGRVLVNTEPVLIGVDFQSAARTAVQVAEMKTGKSLKSYDIIFSVKVKENISAVDGPSAGGAMTVLLISIIERKILRNDVIITGTISPDGTIGKVGGVMQKAEAAAKKGMKIFLVPKGQIIQPTYIEKEIKRGPFTFIYYDIEYVNLAEIMKEKYGMEVYEVSNIDEALKYFIQSS
ncbi:MAG: S16 family serine protease [Candidatus Aenigmatarchaeota archaeon]